TGPELNLSADDVMENIRTFTVGIADSDFVRGGIEQLRNLTRGKINPSQEKVAQMIFQLIRGTVANFLATASLPELLRQFVGPEIEQQARAIGKELNWRLALEAYWKTEAGRKVAARNGRPNRPTFTDMATMSTDQVQALVLPSPLVKEYWDENYGKWSLFAQEQKARKQKITVPMPKIEDGETENAKKQYQDRLVKAQLTPIPVTAPTETPRTQIIGTLDFGTTGKVEVTPEGRPIDVASKRVTFKKEGNIYTMSFPEGNGMRRIELVDAFSTTGQRGNFNKIELSNRGATDAALVKVVFNGGTEADGMTLGALVAEAINRPGKPKAVFASRTAVTFE
ncbi:MAG: hypothetical protein HOO67_06605, partial [Candidatus Peribacteraceae bacterium]|nr:hypothetical protein [Candidatus Peribacteraceae bacterium]